MVGSTCGEAIIPILLGIAIQHISYSMLPDLIILLTLFFIAIYITIHLVSIHLSLMKRNIDGELSRITEDEESSPLIRSYGATDLPATTKSLL